MLERGNQEYDVDENELKEMRTGSESHTQLQRVLTPPERVAQASLLFEEVTSVGSCRSAAWLDQGSQGSTDIVCDCKAMGTVLHGEDVRPRAQWNIDGINRARGGV